MCHHEQSIGYWYFWNTQTPKSNLETDSCNFSNVRSNELDHFQSNCGEGSLIFNLNEKSDEELLEIFKQPLILGEIVYKLIKKG